MHKNGNFEVNQPKTVSMLFLQTMNSSYKKGR